ncbi:unnamed protein product [Auanema sp. JU1783]|nr:unnamed protein product [Auanema sp. JU1783]
MGVDNNIFSNVLTSRNDLLGENLKAGADANLHDDGGRTALHYASFLGNIESIELLIKNGAKCDARDRDGSTPLHKAAAMDKIKAVNRLLSAGCKVNPKCKISQTPLHACAIHFSYDSARALLAKYSNMIDKQDINGCTALHHAAYYGHCQLVDLFLQNGADVTIGDKKGRTAAHWAAIGAKTQVFNLLLKAGIDINVDTYDKQTPLHYAAMSSSMEMVGVISAHVDTLINAVDNKGYTAVHYAAADGGLDMIKELVAAGAKLDIPADDGTTPLHVAVKYADRSITNYIITNLSVKRINDITKNGATALHLACLSEDYKKAMKLLSVGARVDAKCWDGSTPLHYACLNNQYILINAFLQAGCDINAKMTNGITPLHVAAMHCSVEAIDLLINLGAKIDMKDENGITPLMLASKDPESTAAARILLDNGAEVNTRSRKGWTALHFAILNSSREMIGCLLEGGADIAAGENKNRTPLHFAVLGQRDDSNVVIAKALCEFKPDLYMTFDSSRLLPVHYAAAFGNSDCCILFLERMFNEHKATFYHSGLTPLHFACMHNKPDVVDVLLTWERNKITQQSLAQHADATHKIPLHYAMQAGHLECVKLLLQVNPKSQLNWYDSNGATPLHLAAEADQTNCIDYCLSLPPEYLMVNILDNSKRTSGMIALTSCKKPSYQLIQLSNKHLVDKHGRGYLHRAAASKSSECFELLLGSCDLNARDKQLVTPLHIAAALGNNDFVLQLINAGANVDVFDYRGLSPADWASCHGQVKVLKHLMDPSKWTNGQLQANVNKSPLSDKALILAAKEGHYETVSYLHDGNYCSLGATDHTGRTALHWAAQNGHYEVVEYLVEKNADLDCLDKDKNTPLMLSVNKNQYSTVTDLLINKGCDPMIQDVNGNTALHLATLNKNEEASRIIFDSLLSLSDKEVLATKNNNGETFVHCVAQSGLSDFLSYILPHCVSSVFMRDKRGRLPICCGIDDENITDCIMLLYYFSLPEDESKQNLSHLSARKSSQSMGEGDDTF